MHQTESHKSSEYTGWYVLSLIQVCIAKNMYECYFCTFTKRICSWGLYKMQNWINIIITMYEWIAQNINKFLIQKKNVIRTQGNMVILELSHVDDRLRKENKKIMLFFYGAKSLTLLCIVYLRSRYFKCTYLNSSLSR
jgi:hypothetical protein